MDVFDNNMIMPYHFNKVLATDPNNEDALLAKTQTYLSNFLNKFFLSSINILL